MAAIDFESAYAQEKQARLQAERMLDEKSREVDSSIATIQHQYKSLMSQKRGLELLLNIAQVGELHLSFVDSLKIFLDAIGQLFEAEYGVYFFRDATVSQNEKELFLASTLCYLPKDFYETRYLALLSGKRMITITQESAHNFRKVKLSQWDEYASRVGVDKDLIFMSYSAAYDSTTDKKCFSNDRFITVPIHQGGKCVAVAELGIPNWNAEKEAYLTMVQVAATQLSVQLERSKAQNELQKNYSQLKDAHEDLKRAQDQLVHSEKMASIGQLAAGIAHEINNPVGFVLSNVETLNDYLKVLLAILNSQDECFNLLDQDKTDAAVSVRNRITQFKDKENLGFILADLDQVVKDSVSGLLRVKDIVLSLKNFSRVGESCRSSAILDDVVKESIKLVANEIKYKCELKSELAAPEAIECNSSQLSQVIINLLINAAQAIDQQGIIEVKTKQNEQEVMLTVSDTGCGMSEKVKRKVFDPFYTTKPVNEGTGLGLSITHGIIESHGGKIFVNSVLGKGTTFTILLPRSMSD